MDSVLYVAAALTGVWGVSHLLATRGVVQGFGELSTDNRRIITIEWIVEGVALLVLGILVAVVTAVDSTAGVASAAYAVVIAALLVLAIVSLLTGFRIAFLPFRLCPFIFTASAVLVGVGAWV